ncbi:MAG: LemA family protein [Candidatus Peregrinibacteria bacterium]|nr:LemA family protein [Candidatus Peregrinibacteria bacterium]
MNPIIIIFVVAAVFFLIYTLAYNSLVRVQRKIQESWLEIDVQLKRRYDLIPNLVNRIKESVTNEEELLNKIMTVRSQAMEVPEGQIGDKARIESLLSITLKSILDLDKSYLELNSNQSFNDFKGTLSEIKGQISAAQIIYNENVTQLNTKVQTSPLSIVANIHGITSEEFFEIEEKEAVAPPPPPVQF